VTQSKFGWPWDVGTTNYTVSQEDRVVTSSRAGATMLAHPRGCPARNFCGCGAASAVFGYPRRDLWLAANWLKFRHVAPSMARGGMAAARRGHVFVLVSHRGGNVWLVKDFNSGGHRSRLHERSIAGYTIVDPHG
jgi:hypothetical protein